MRVSTLSATFIFALSGLVVAAPAPRVGGPACRSVYDTNTDTDGLPRCSTQDKREPEVDVRDITGPGKRDIPGPGKRDIPGPGKRDLPGPGKRDLPGPGKRDLPGPGKRETATEGESDEDNLIINCRRDANGKRTHC